MNNLDHANGTILRLIDLLRTSGGLLLDAHVFEEPPENLADLPDIAPELFIDLSGKDSSLLLRNDAELLRAIHYYTASALHLELEELDRLWFDVDHLKAAKRVEFQRLADAAVHRVRDSGESHAFVPMPGCERHMLHRAIEPSGLRSASVGLGAGRRVVLYPERAPSPNGRSTPDSYLQIPN